VRRATQATLDRCGVGVTLIGINLQAASPPPEAAQAFRDVSDARADAARAVNEAQSEGERGLSLARGSARGLVEEARAGADGRRRRARGAAARFDALLARLRAAPAQTRTEIYLDTARRVLPRARLVLLAPGAAPRIDLNLMDPRTPSLQELP
jgi:membrane protease subunit HflK